MVLSTRRWARQLRRSSSNVLRRCHDVLYVVEPSCSVAYTYQIRSLKAGLLKNATGLEREILPLLNAAGCHSSRV